jgi:LuxR family quorum-sensing system transcriptional regulator SolR
MPWKVLCDAFDAIDRARSSNELKPEIERFSKAMGFELFAYALTVRAPSLKPKQHVINGFPLPWVDRYVSAGYFEVDPLVRHAERSSLPAIWSDQMFHDGPTAQFWDEARSFGLSSGLSFSVHEQPGVIGIFSLARDRAIDLPDGELAALIGRTQMFASLLHHAVVRIDLPKLLPEQNAILTAREKECMKWAADGKTAWEIGQILSIAERTAVFHMSNVMQKLGAANRTQAIVRAVALRLI